MRRALLLLLISACYRATIVARPGEDFGVVRYFNASLFGADDGRDRAKELMRTVCAGPFRIEFEEEDPGAGRGDWRLIHFSCWADDAHRETLQPPR